MAVSVAGSIDHPSLLMLLADGRLHSGEWLAQELGVSRAAVWKGIERLPFKDVNDLYYDATQDKVLVSSRDSDFVYEIDPARLNWTWARAGWKVQLIRSAGGHLLGASLFDGVLVEPRSGGI